MTRYTPRRPSGRLRWIVGIVVLVAVLFAGCGESGDSDETAATDQPSAGTTATTGTTAATGTTASTGTTSTSAAIGEQTSVQPSAVDTSATDPSAGGDGGPSDLVADGSGCNPGDAESLPDGRWFGYIVAANPETVAFDLACWFTGEAAATAAAEDGEESPPPNDFHIRNRFDVLRVLMVDQSATISIFTDPGDPATEVENSYEAWIAQSADRDEIRPVWVTVTKGLVATIEEQYIP